MPIFDYQCDRCEPFEKMVKHYDDRVYCNCGYQATRKLSAPSIQLESISGDFPGATMKWERARPPMTAKQIEFDAQRKIERKQE